MHVRYKREVEVIHFLAAGDFFEKFKKIKFCSKIAESNGVFKCLTICCIYMYLFKIYSCKSTVTLFYRAEGRSTFPQLPYDIMLYFKFNRFTVNSNLASSDQY